MRLDRVALCLCCVATACLGIKPPAQPPTPTDTYIRAPFDTTWQRVIGFFADSRVPIQTIEKASGLIVSTKFRLSDEQTLVWADCGRGRGGTAFEAVKRMGLGLPLVLADFNVFVRPSVDSTAVRVNLTLNGENDLQVSGHTSMVCVTNGKFEQALIARVSHP
jgi:hypothetical protein